MNSSSKNEAILERQKSSKLRSIIGPFSIGVTLTTLYLGVIIYEVLIVGASGEWIDNNKLNSLGDFLAGLFAPVAFLWLVVTVFLQKQELALTRQEMVETREVMIEQAAEARAQKEFVEQQTAIMKRQADLAEESYKKSRKLEMFDKRMEIYDEIKRYTEMPFYDFMDGATYMDFLHLINKARYVFAGDENISNWMHDLSEVVYSCSNEPENVENLKYEWENISSPGRFDTMFHTHLNLAD
ncbi:hypothetical protein EXN32_22470 [Agrobacterium tumefaciens]|uniref:hypothetical protein n=1 Tax=Agrobacterium TaxID=357 RepID=UPI00115D5805|nr:MULTISPECIES: hypothetical protein [Agrobacterium]MDA5241027.1 hypothetical protein [Agrobacterium sp. MAFF310724]MDA5249741.1 hypothetical protein [Agrobacterium sp. MAFF210268]TRB12252.1 hypothetical protein EXN32_22470 [Agrobacterium tumefaciens]